MTKIESVTTEHIIQAIGFAFGDELKGNVIVTRKGSTVWITEHYSRGNRVKRRWSIRVRKEV